jgi:polyphosphate kinase
MLNIVRDNVITTLKEEFLEIDDAEAEALILEDASFIFYNIDVLLRKFFEDYGQDFITTVEKAAAAAYNHAVKADLTLRIFKKQIYMNSLATDAVIQPFVGKLERPQYMLYNVYVSKYKFKARDTRRTLIFAAPTSRKFWDSYIERIQAEYNELMHDKYDINIVKLPLSVYLIEDLPRPAHMSITQPEVIPEKHEWNEQIGFGVEEKIFRVPENVDQLYQFFNTIKNSPDISKVYMTLYRANLDGEILRCLDYAADREIDIYLYVEPNARGNEDANEILIDSLTDKPNFHVSYTNNWEGILKVHSKCCLVEMKTGKKHLLIGSGNFHDKKLHTYVDTFYQTSSEHNKTLIKMISTMFDVLTTSENMRTVGFEDIEKIIDPYNHNRVSPGGIRNLLIGFFKTARTRVWIKCNDISDLTMINTIASITGKYVDIKIITRTSRLTEDFPNDCEVRTKIGDYLEHDRLYIIDNAAYIGSADLKGSSLYNRIENLIRVPVDLTEKVVSMFESDWQASEPYRHLPEYEADETILGIE